jgi:hypothetical protein
MPTPAEAGATKDTKVAPALDDAEKLFGATAPYGRGSVCCCKRSVSILSRDHRERFSEFFSIVFSLCFLFDFFTAYSAPHFGDCPNMVQALRNSPSPRLPNYSFFNDMAPARPLASQMPLCSPSGSQSVRRIENA